MGETMATRKQIEANRANAKKSTGPKTHAGKDRARLNARKHGLTSRLLVIDEEDPTEFEELRAALMAQYDPHTPTECEFVEYLASQFWRLRRIPFFEAAIFAARHAQVATEMEEGSARLARVEVDREDGDDEGELSDAETLICVGRTLIKDGVWSDAFGKLTRYETALLNGLKKTLAMLDEASGAQATKNTTISLKAVPSAA